MSLRHLRCLALFLVILSPSLWAHNAPSYDQASQATKNVADAYFKAYIARDWDRLEPLLSKTVGFVDPTAALVFGSVKVQGKAATMKKFRTGYAAIRHMEFHQIRAFHSGEYAVYEGTLDWTLELDNGKQAVTKGMPFVTVLRVVNGHVLEHRDLADYAPFLAAMRATRQEAG